MRLKGYITIVGFSVIVLLCSDAASEQEPYCIAEAKWHVPVGKPISLTMSDSGRVNGIVDSFDAELQTLTISSIGSYDSVAYPYADIAEIRYSVGRNSQKSVMGAGAIIGAIAGFFIGNGSGEEWAYGAQYHSSKSGRLVAYTIGGGVVGMLTGAAIYPAFDKTETISCLDF